MEDLISPFVQTLLILGGINAILALSVYLPFSGGQLSMAQGGFMAIGAYTSAVLTHKLGVPFGFALIGGACLSSLVGIGVCFPALKIKGIYLLLITLGFNEVIRVIFLNLRYTGGVGGFGGIEPKTTLFNLYLVLFLLIIFFHRLQHSRLGRALRAMNSDQDAAEARGIPLTRLKTFAFGAGGFIAGLAGGFYAHFVVFIVSDNFGFHRSLEAMMFPVLGGSQVFWGSILGAYLITIIPEVFRPLQAFRFEFFGACLVITMILRPMGLLDAEICQLKWWKRRVFRRPQDG
jgi:branched-chain amino acid transport system permease protein